MARRGRFGVGRALTRGLAIGAVLLSVSLGGLLIFDVAFDGAVGDRLPLLIPTAHANDPVMEDFVFYGIEYEGDSFVWCIDRGCSMAWGGTFNALRDELITAINQLTPSHDFGLVAFGTNTLVWEDMPVPATAASKASAESFINALNPSGWTCIGDALLETVALSEAAVGPSRTIILIGDGGVCDQPEDFDQIVLDVTAANTAGATIDTLLVGFAAGPADENFYEALAAANGGQFYLDPPFGEADHNFFRRGDIDGDGDVLAIADALYLLAHSFLCGPAPTCLDAADVDDNGAVEAIPDVIYLLNAQFVAGAPLIPYPGSGECGVDPYLYDGINCDDYGACP